MPWDRLAGAAVGGGYVLEQPQTADDERAGFRARTESGGPALIELVREHPATAEAQLTCWRAAARLSHPNLLRLLECGRAGLVGQSADASYLFAAFEYPDDTLAPALASGPMSEPEAADVARAAIPALRYLHANGLVMGSLDAADVVAVGDRIKLATAGVRPPGPKASPEDDMRALRALTHRLLGLPASARLSEPLRSLIGSADPEPAAAPLAHVPTPRDDDRPPSRFSRMPGWVWMATAVPVLALVFGLARAPRKPAPTPAAPAAAAPVVRRPVFVPPERASDAPARTAATPARDAPGRAWRVVAYTYNGLAAAEAKVRRVNQRWPGFHAEVFAPKGRGRGPYMVALGGRMTRAEAARVQQSARRNGLPRDTFIRNYSE
jgi:hypothetical protein